jgi:hypothetical protein
VTLGPVVVDQGGEGVASALAGEVLHLVLDRPYAPGAPITMKLVLPGGDLSLQGRTIASKRRDDGHFDVRLRMINLTRESRARLAAT